jgi:hypothetical protein
MIHPPAGIQNVREETAMKGKNTDSESYQAPKGGQTGQERAPSSMGSPEPEHVEASLHGKATGAKQGGKSVRPPVSPGEGVTEEQMKRSGRDD